MVGVAVGGRHVRGDVAHAFEQLLREVAAEGLFQPGRLCFQALCGVLGRLACAAGGQGRGKSMRGAMQEPRARVERAAGGPSCRTCEQHLFCNALMQPSFPQ